MMTDLSRDASLGIARVKALQMRCCGCYCWMLDVVDARARVDKQSR